MCSLDFKNTPISYIVQWNLDNTNISGQTCTQSYILQISQNHFLDFYLIFKRWLNILTKIYWKMKIIDPLTHYNGDVTTHCYIWRIKSDKFQRHICIYIPSYRKSLLQQPVLLHTHLLRQWGEKSYELWRNLLI